MPSPEELPDYERHGLFLVDRWGAHAPRVPHLAPRQMICLEFQQFVTPDDGRKFTELYNVQHLQSAQLDRVSRVCISTIQRLYSILCSLFFWDRNTDAAKRDQREEAGNASTALNEAGGLVPANPELSRGMPTIFD